MASFTSTSWQISTSPTFTSKRAEIRTAWVTRPQSTLVKSEACAPSNPLFKLGVHTLLGLPLGFGACPTRAPCVLFSWLPLLQTSSARIQDFGFSKAHVTGRRVPGLQTTATCTAPASVSPPALRGQDKDAKRPRTPTLYPTSSKGPSSYR